MHKLKLGIIGVGSVVREIYQYLYFKSIFSENLQIVAVADPNEECRNWFCDKYNIKKDLRYESYEEMIMECELDAVHVNTPDNLHLEPTLYCLKRGIDVQMPKPTSTKIKDVHLIIDTARKNNRIFGVDFHKRDDPRIVELANRYKSGRYGVMQIAD